MLSIMGEQELSRIGECGCNINVIVHVCNAQCTAIHDGVRQASDPRTVAVSSLLALINRERALLDVR